LNGQLASMEVIAEDRHRGSIPARWNVNLSTPGPRLTGTRPLHHRPPGLCHTNGAGVQGL
jgi:hypothetical protein